MHYADYKTILSSNNGMNLYRGCTHVFILKKSYNTLGNVLSYFYHKLDELFPGMKEKYINQFGNSYICKSPNDDRLREIYYETCHKHGIVCNTNDIFSYLYHFETRNKQMSLFEL